MRIPFKRIIKRLLRFMLWIMGITFLWVLLLKWIPVFFTPTMFFRSMEAWAEGKDARIYYEWVNYSQISDHVKVAVVASEDQRFPQHTGIDFAAIEVAIEENKLRKKMGYNPRGASTISQQVAKNVFLWQGGGYFRKALEVPLTYLIEILWGKQRILEVYLNIAEMGNQTFGIQAVARRHLKKSASQITAYDAAAIAAVLPNPRQYSIQIPSPYIQMRSGQILYQMRLLGGYDYLKNLRKF
jgi:monofunctional glycosyltransferase